MKKPLIFIKLGGSVITDKSKAFSLKSDVIKKIAADIKEIIDKNPDKQFILANGAGSFGHYLALKYNTKDGVKDGNTFGFCEEQHVDKKLNQIIVEELIKNKVSVSSFHPSSMIVSSNGKVEKIFLEPLLEALRLSIIPVMYGAVIYDRAKGCRIFSTEDLFNILIDNLLKLNFKVDKIVHLSTVDGVFNKKGEVIKKITNETYAKQDRLLHTTVGFDVTGGMRHKIEKSLILAERGIKTYILNGHSKDDLLKKVINNSPFTGTVIE